MFCFRKKADNPIFHKTLRNNEINESNKKNTGDKRLK